MFKRLQDPHWQKNRIENNGNRMSTEQNVTGQKALHNKNDYNGNVQARPPHHAASFKVQAPRYQSKRITYPLFACSFSVKDACL